MKRHAIVTTAVQIVTMPLSWFAACGVTVFRLWEVLRVVIAASAADEPYSEATPTVAR